MSEMIKKVAAALEKRVDEVGRWNGILYTDLARVAIEALREPTEEMATAGRATEDQYEGGSYEESWPAMIEAALQDSPPTIRVEGGTQ